jgi:preprotein translocase subunit YajC
MSNTDRSIKNITPVSYSINLIKFCSITLSDLIPIIFSYVAFNIYDNQPSIGYCGMLYSAYSIFFGLCFDFFEPINTLCLPFLEKNNIKLYSIKVWQLIFLNSFMYLIMLIIFCIFRYALLKNREKLPQDIIGSMEFGHIYVMTSGLAFIINNFLRGIHFIRINRKYQNGKYLFANLYCSKHNQYNFNFFDRKI